MFSLFQCNKNRSILVNKVVHQISLFLGLLFKLRVQKPSSKKWKSKKSSSMFHEKIVKFK